jgi:beta-glucanase (GH16 family)
MKTYFPLFFIILAFAACKSDDDDSDPDYNGYTLIWSEEFNENISSDNWTYRLGDGTDYGLPAGWGNNEKQIYTSSSNNSLVRIDEDGNSVFDIIAKKEPGYPGFSSASIHTENLLNFRFGRIEARIKIPEGKGIFPGFWVTGENISEIGWPGCGDILIGGVVGEVPDVLYSSVLYIDSDNKIGESYVEYSASQNLSEDYHIYRMDWTPEEMKFSLDGQEILQVSIEDDMKEFLRPVFLNLGLTVGGNIAGHPDETTVFPCHMFIDWIRVYEIDDLSPPDPPELNIEEEYNGNISLRLAKHIFNSSFDYFDDVRIISYGDGGEPDFFPSDITIEGDSSVLFSFPGGNWGGAFFIMDPVVDASQFANGNLKFSLHKPAELVNMEIKLESTSTQSSLYILDYVGVDVGNGFLEYTIPFSDFQGLDLSKLMIPFALWNPIDAGGPYSFVTADVLLDNVYYETGN